MKKLLLLVLLLISFNSFAQLSYKDIYLIKRSDNVRLAGYALIKYNNFSFDNKDIVHEGHGGWFKFSNNKDWLLLKNHTFQDSNGKQQSELIVNYFINDNRSYDYFVKDLTDDKFEREFIKDKDGKTSEMWVGTNQIMFVIISHESGMYKVSIM